MAEYTKQEIEMLARCLYPMNLRDDPRRDGWPFIDDLARELYRNDVCRGLEGGCEQWSIACLTAACLMREARKQGAEEMRKKAVGAVTDGDWHLRKGFDIDIVDAIRALPLPGDPNVSS